MWDLLVTGRIKEAKQIQRGAEAINEIIAEGHPTYGHQCYSKALAAAAGYPVGDVRPPLTRFDNLGQEGVGRRDKMLAMMADVEALARGMEAKVRSG